MRRTGWWLVAAYTVLSGVRIGLSVRNWRRVEQVSTRSTAEAGSTEQVTVLQPILAGDPELPGCRRQCGRPSGRPVPVAGGRRRHRRARDLRAAGGGPRGPDRGAAVPALSAADQPEGVQAGPRPAALHAVRGSAGRRHRAAARSVGTGPSGPGRRRPGDRPALVPPRRRAVVGAGRRLRQRQRPDQLLPPARLRPTGQHQRHVLPDQPDGAGPRRWLRGDHGPGLRRLRTRPGVSADGLESRRPPSPIRSAPRFRTPPRTPG